MLANIARFLPPYVSMAESWMRVRLPACPEILATPIAGDTRDFGTNGTGNISRAFLTATLLPNGQVVVAGGESGSGRTFNLLTSAELYTP